jgi:DNA-binding FadR family transcriptional regulator
MVSGFYRAFDASLDTGGQMKRSIASLLRAIGAGSQRLPHRLLAEAIRSGDEERARVIARAMIVGAQLTSQAVAALQSRRRSGRHPCIVSGYSHVPASASSLAGNAP